MKKIMWIGLALTVGMALLLTGSLCNTSSGTSTGTAPALESTNWYMQCMGMRTGTSLNGDSIALREYTAQAILELYGYTDVTVSAYCERILLENSTVNIRDEMYISAGGTVTPWGSVSGYMASGDYQGKVFLPIGDIYRNDDTDAYELLDSDHVWTESMGTTFYFEIIGQELHMESVTADQAINVILETALQLP